MTETDSLLEWTSRTVPMIDLRTSESVFASTMLLRLTAPDGFWANGTVIWHDDPRTGPRRALPDPTTPARPEIRGAS